MPPKANVHNIRVVVSDSTHLMGAGGQHGEGGLQLQDGGLGRVEVAEHAEEAAHEQGLLRDETVEDLAALLGRRGWWCQLLSNANRLSAMMR